jgi:hypothetical protein
MKGGDMGQAIGTVYIDVEEQVCHPRVHGQEISVAAPVIGVDHGLAHLPRLSVHD